MTASEQVRAAIEALGRERGLDRPAIDRVTTTVFGLVGREADVAAARRLSWLGHDGDAA
jgi:hypothetical protein